jgi:hypothetical protein
LACSACGRTAEVIEVTEVIVEAGADELKGVDAETPGG